MRYNRHLHLEGQHAILSASNHHWIRYTDEKMDHRFKTRLAAERGTRLHDLANRAIRLKRFMPDDGDSFNMYVNDAIRLGLVPELTVYYSLNSYGTADAIGFSQPPLSLRWLLRIHDLKTGVAKTSVDQLYVYAALFCLEYGVKPYEIDYEFRIYQNDEIQVYDQVDPGEVLRIMGMIVHFDKRIDRLREESDA